MRRLSIALLVFVTVAQACGGHAYPTGVNSIPEEGVNQDEEKFSLGLSESGPNVDVQGIYVVTTVTFDSDPSEEFATASTVTTISRDIEGSTDGEAWIQTAFIEQSYLKLMSDMTFEFYYRFVDSRGNVVDVGKFSEGVQNGEYEIEGNILSFYPTPSGDLGFAHAGDSEYYVTEQGNGRTLTALNPSPYGEYFTRLVAKQ